MKVPSHFGRYPTLSSLEDTWSALAHRAGAALTTCGRSVEGRAIPRLDLGPRDAPTTLVTALMHGNELIGGLALHGVVQELVLRGRPLENTRLVVLPIVNPDAVHATVRALERRGPSFGRRKNARGVDLNRNFPVVTDARPRHPFAGSTTPGAAYYMGAHALCEPESRAVADVARATRPVASLGFHSFGNLLLFPWAHTRRPHPETTRYRALGDAFVSAQPKTRYRLGPAIGLYPTVGDLDDWLDQTFGTLAYTVEVSRPSTALLHPRRLVNPFCWMNPLAVDETVHNVVPGVLGFLRAAPRVARAPRPSTSPATAWRARPAREAPSALPLAARR